MINLPTVLASVAASALVAIAVSPAAQNSSVDRCLQEGVAVSQFHNPNGTSYLAPTKRAKQAHLIVAVWNKDCEPKHLSRSFMTWNHSATPAVDTRQKVGTRPVASKLPGGGEGSAS